jgi:hypothetical protein
MDRSLNRENWVEDLRAFTNRNAGRRTAMEVDGEAFGAQSAETGYPLRGVAFDPRDERVEIMLGEQGSVERRLTHTIENARAIDLLQDERGRDAALRIVHDGAQTVLRILSG